MTGVGAVNGGDRPKDTGRGEERSVGTSKCSGEQCHGIPMHELRKTAIR